MLTSKRKAKGTKQAEVQRSGGRADGVFQQRGHGPLGKVCGVPRAYFRLTKPRFALNISYFVYLPGKHPREPVLPASLPCQPPHPNLCGFHNTTYPYVLKISSSLVAHLVKNLPLMQETQVRFLGWEDPLEKG